MKRAKVALDDPRPRDQQSRRDRILTAAIDRFQLEGLSGVSMRTVAADVGMSPMGLYRHFADRDALVDAMVDRCLAAFEEALRSTTRRGTPLQRLRGLMRAYVDFALGERAMYDLLFRSTRPSNDPFFDEYKAGTSPSFELLRAAVADVMATADVSDANSVEAAVSIWAQAHGLTSLFLAGRFGGGEQLFRKFYMRSMERVIVTFAH
ncbi:MAG: TetR/AcrR family transcriptional regulator [Gemmatimonadaceae bacterium]